ncbi:VOC family protein [Cupriavidus taiwanensis]|uniref:Putative dioxygenase, Glyoxalase/bleomycin resistance protein n=1 Tax=Cupriavidus taiwanensis TaxID=164546 RepID=A0A375IGF8_9BURK|nr:VOC family protein [Cupriavidus taiwanensis]SOZ21216.1 putative dioxygenase, Glyoxalase/bleomycin resistance protein [Cupriavidus taiwanensis]SPA25608.1 putative dioxygenase, Glyoxalase/bleomycin resistance protein [Cupriavidus taiwanensis]SPK72305.1 putative dioxygenase, Glyoxalase/bleomycin resistance protein [Cupriavidus taiwanensis]
MAIQLNHTIVFSRDKQVAADFLCEVLDRPPAEPFGPFLGVALDNGVTLDFMDAQGEIAMQHYAFLVSDAEFDHGLACVRAHQLPYWADPYRRRPGEVNTDDGGRRIYFEDPSKHFLEIFTKG